LQNKIRDWHRKQAVRRRWQHWFGRSTEQDEVQGVDNLPDPEDRGPASQAALSMASEAFLEALDRLPSRQQQVFMLRVWEGLDVADTAMAMSCSQGSVKTHYSRAVHRLREALEDHWP
jgi:RNA polymerase sigma-70 factor (ECF subfamily)